MDPTHIAAFSSILGDDARVLTQPQLVEQLSRDFYWYSPVLRKQLDGKTGDLVVQPLNVAEIQGVLRYCHAHDLAGDGAGRRHGKLWTGSSAARRRCAGPRAAWIGRSDSA